MKPLDPEVAALRGEEFRDMIDDWRKNRRKPPTPFLEMLLSQRVVVAPPGANLKG